MVGLSALVGVAIWQTRADDGKQAAADASWRQYIIDSGNGMRQEDADYHTGVDCEWMRDILADRTPSVLLAPGATPQPVVLDEDARWPSKKVAQEYLDKLC